MKQIYEYNTFIDIGKYIITPHWYTDIRVPLIYGIKHDTRHKSRCVANGNLIEVPIDSVYSGVSSLYGLRTMIFLDKLNKLDIRETYCYNYRSMY